MGNISVLVTFGLACLVAATVAFSFENAYLQNVESGKCATIEKDYYDDPLYAKKCKCAPYQFWRTENELVMNELAKLGYMQQVKGSKNNGDIVGINAKTGTGAKHQKWRFNELDDGTYHIIVEHTSKCLREGPSGKLDQWECIGDEPAKKWKIIEHPCGTTPNIPDHFQLRNPATGMCASVKGNNHAPFTQISLEKCTCENKFQWWHYNRKRFISEGQAREYCLVNMEAQNKPGVVQQSCGIEPYHIMRIAPLDNQGNFQIESQVDARCIFTNGGSESTNLLYKKCDRADEQQTWRFYDACNPEPEPAPTPKPTPAPVTETPTAPPVPEPPVTAPPTPPAPITAPPTPPAPITAPPTPAPAPINEIPAYLRFFFDSGMMNWLTPTRYSLLIGGRWDPATNTWITADGRRIVPGTDLWKIYFGGVDPSFLNMLFAGGKSWDDVFGWMTPAFFEIWTGWRNVPTPTPQPIPIPIPQPPKDQIPAHLMPIFMGGNMNWLTPERYLLLVGGRWDAKTLTYYTADGKQIRYPSAEWSTYFGTLKPADVTAIFSSGNGSWNDTFGWMTINFFKVWTGWQKPEVIHHRIKIIIPANIPLATRRLFQSGEVNWLTPDRIRLLAGGSWTGNVYVTRTHEVIVPGTPAWNVYFGTATVADVNKLLGGPGAWDDSMGWLLDTVKEVPSGQYMTTFPWDQLFAGASV